MAGYVIVGALAAVGAMSILWVFFGWLLPGMTGGVLVYLRRPCEGSLRRYRWLRELGLVRCPLLIVTEEEFEPQPMGCGIESCSLSELTDRLKQERML